MHSTKQAHGGNSRPGKVTMNPGFKTNISMTNCNCTPTPAQKLKPVIYQTHAAKNGNGTS